MSDNVDDRPTTSLKLLPEPAQRPTYWRSLDELADTPAFRAFRDAEFPEPLPDFAAAAQRWSTSRRHFLRLMGVSLSLAGAAGCRWPKETIVPATRRPANRTPGVPVQYASALESDGVSTGLLVTSVDGRPIKIEGNEKHPDSRGRTNHWHQASILDLYDPDRSQRPIHRPDASTTKNRTWTEFEQAADEVFAQVRSAKGAGLTVIAPPASSPSLHDLRVRLTKTLPQADWCTYTPVDRANETIAAKMSFGKACRRNLHLDKADVVVSFDSDFLMQHPAAVKYAGDFAERRDPAVGEMNRLYVVESDFSVTGSAADHRYAVRSCDIGLVVRAVWQAVHAAQQGDFPQTPIAGETVLSWRAIRTIAEDIIAHRGRSVVVVGSQQPAWVHQLADAINGAAEAYGATITLVESPEDDRPAGVDALRKLAERVERGATDTLLILGGNPVYDAPADIDFAGVLGECRTSIHLSLYDNETSQACTWHVPQAHWLESWGDGRAWDGTITLTQPLIEPLYGGRTACELLAFVLGEATRGAYEITRGTFERLTGTNDIEERWKQALHAGVVADSARPTVTVAGPSKPADAAVEQAPGYEVVFRPDYSVGDGTCANNAWLQEWPDPITKLTWDNAALIAPTDADELGVERSGDLIEIMVDDTRRLTLPACIVPGHATGSITVPLGYGRRPAAGAVAAGVGRSAYPLRDSQSLGWTMLREVKRVAGYHKLVGTQDHHAIASDVGDAATQERIPILVREMTLDEYKHPHEAHHGHHPPLKSLWQEKEYTDHKWGMAIDLSRCVGCGACVVACQAENNIPVVGKDEVAVGREMHWIRVDRYFRGDPHGDVRIAHQPVACVQCEMAPCEQVCPVGATVHDEEGLNVMVYNRCIGTRYCSNNCPFKVRRFNWFYNHHGPAHPRSVHGESSRLPGLMKQQYLQNVEKMQHNPEVTVRSRGVMEKCSYCVQRINAVKIRARNERWAKIPDGLITPACAQACPSGAIVFGDLNDPDSRVAKLHENERAYAMLAELNIKPRTKYLTRITNPAGAHQEKADSHGEEG